MELSPKKVAVMESAIRVSFLKVKNELDDHLEGINRNTSEIQQLYEFLQVLEVKIDKLHERLDELQLSVRAPALMLPSVAPLTSREQEVFLIVYTSELPVSVAVIADRLGLSCGVVRRAAARLVMKGVPLLQQEQGGEVLFSLELRFKDAQARLGLVRIDEVVSRELLEQEPL